MTKKWLWNNIGRVVSLLALVGVIGGYAAAILPMPAKASDLEDLDKRTQIRFDKMASAIQKFAEILSTSTVDSDIRDKQAEIRAIKRDFSSAGKPISQDSQITIDTLEDEIDELRWQRDNQ